MKDLKDEAKMLLLSVKRDGMKELVEFLETEGFFNMPASSKYHGNYKGGLLNHSLNVYNMFWSKCREYKLNILHENAIIAGLLHDLCKYKLYLNYANGYIFNTKEGDNIAIYGHAGYSLNLIKRFIQLEPIEESLIKFHMGFYDCKEINNDGMYILPELKQAFNNKIIKLFYFCDDMSAQFEEEQI